MNFETWFSTRGKDIPWRGAEGVLKLSGTGATVPFIARYRKEATGNLDEVQIQKVIDLQEEWNEITKRQAFILTEIESQQKLTSELRDKISKTFDKDLLEDIYLPFKQKKKSKAMLAKEAGLQPLADWIWNCGHGTEKPLSGQTLEIWAYTFRKEEKGIKEAKEAIDGATDILVERISEDQDLRAYVREEISKKGCLWAVKTNKAKPSGKFTKYFDYHEPVSSLAMPQNTHRYLAVRRGWIEQELTLSLAGEPKDPDFEKRLLSRFEAFACTVPDSPGADALKKAAMHAYKVHVFPSLEREMHRKLREVADAIAIDVFASNLKKLLLSSPFGPKTVLGVDPGIRTGCKLALVDNAGKFIAHHVIHIQSEEEKNKAKELLTTIVNATELAAIAVGNGTGGREVATFLRQVLKDLGKTISIQMVNEAGASVYSASENAREEFPNLDITIRGAISIARRFQDPLAELVKIEPKSIGVGQYQHDVAPHALKKGLELVVDNCVNSVGVNLNTSSYHLLARVSGIGPGLAKSIVNYRQEKGIFKSRAGLLEVPYFSSKAFEQAAGFLRVPESENPLDNTGVHPERYPSLEKVATRLSKSVLQLVGSDGAKVLREDNEFKAEVGEFTSADIIAEIEKPGRDPRDSFVPFNYKEGVYELKDLTVGMELPGVVTNVTNFGAFVDVGVHQDGLVHLSQLSTRFVKDPKDVVEPGDRVNVRVLEVDLEKKQIALSMKPVQAARPPRESRQQRPQGPRAQGAPGGSHGERPQNAGGRPGSNSGGRPQGPAGSSPGGRPQNAGGRPGANAGGRPGSNSGGSPGSGPGGRQRAGDRPSGGRPGAGPGGRPGSSSGGRPGSNSGGRPQHSGGGGGRSGGPPRREDRPPPQLTQNPFAVLAALKADQKDQQKK